MKQFVITRSVSAIVGSKADWELIKPSAPYLPKPRYTKETEKAIVSGIKPPQIAGIRWVVALPQANIPKNLENVLLTGTNTEFIKENVRQTWLPQVLNEATYGRHFSTLIHVEEARMKYILIFSN
jgi:helicase MOV-10